jgi:large subunit ribosomal protein L21
MYAIVKTGGKQYRVEQGSSLLVERLREDEGAKVSLEPLLFVDGEKVHDSGVKVEAKVVGHERGPKLRVVKFKPKRGYKRRTGHRQELTRLEVTSIKGPAARKPRASAEAKEGAAPAEKPAPRRRTTPKAEAAEKPAPRRRTTTKKETASDGS